MNKSSKKIAYDIGSNIGNSTKTLLKRGYSVVAVEANQMLCIAMQERFKNEDVIVLNRAVSNNNGRANFYVCESQNTLSTLSAIWITSSRFSDQLFKRPIQVNCITIDALIDNYGMPDVIKIDVEGHEYEALSGFTKKDVNPMIYFEFTEELFDNTIKCVNHLKELGYNWFSFSLRDDDRTIPKNWNTWENLDIHNWVDPTKKAIWGMIYAMKRV